MLQMDTLLQVVCRNSISSSYTSGNYGDSRCALPQRYPPSPVRRVAGRSATLPLRVGVVSLILIALLATTALLKPIVPPADTYQRVRSDEAPSYPSLLLSSHIVIGAEASSVSEATTTIDTLCYSDGRPSLLDNPTGTGYLLSLNYANTIYTASSCVFDKFTTFGVVNTAAIPTNSDDQIVLSVLNSVITGGAFGGLYIRGYPAANGTEADSPTIGTAPPHTIEVIGCTFTTDTVLIFSQVFPPRTNITVQGNTFVTTQVYGARDAADPTPIIIASKNTAASIHVLTAFRLGAAAGNQFIIAQNNFTIAATHSGTTSVNFYGINVIPTLLALSNRSTFKIDNNTFALSRGEVPTDLFDPSRPPFNGFPPTLSLSWIYRLYAATISAAIVVNASAVLSMSHNTVTYQLYNGSLGFVYSLYLNAQPGTVRDAGARVEVIGNNISGVARQVGTLHCIRVYFTAAGRLTNGAAIAIANNTVVVKQFYSVDGISLLAAPLLLRVSGLSDSTFAAAVAAAVATPTRVVIQDNTLIANQIRLSTSPIGLETGPPVLSQKGFYIVRRNVIALADVVGGTRCVGHNHDTAPSGFTDDSAVIISHNTITMSATNASLLQAMRYCYLGGAAIARNSSFQVNHNTVSVLGYGCDQSWLLHFPKEFGFVTDNSFFSFFNNTATVLLDYRPRQKGIASQAVVLFYMTASVSISNSSSLIISGNRITLDAILLGTVTMMSFAPYANTFGRNLTYGSAFLVVNNSLSLTMCDVSNSAIMANLYSFAPMSNHSLYLVSGNTFSAGYDLLTTRTPVLLTMISLTTSDPIPIYSKSLLVVAGNTISAFIPRPTQATTLGPSCVAIQMPTHDYQSGGWGIVADNVIDIVDNSTYGASGGIIGVQSNDIRFLEPLLPTPSANTTASIGGGLYTPFLTSTVVAKWLTNNFPSASPSVLVPTSSPFADTIINGTIRLLARVTAARERAVCNANGQLYGYDGGFRRRRLSTTGGYDGAAAGGSGIDWATRLSTTCGRRDDDAVEIHTRKFALEAHAGMETSAVRALLASAATSPSSATSSSAVPTELFIIHNNTVNLTRVYAPDQCPPPLIVMGEVLRTFRTVLVGGAHPEDISGGSSSPAGPTIVQWVRRPLLEGWWAVQRNRSTSTSAMNDESSAETATVAIPPTAFLLTSNTMTTAGGDTDARTPTTATCRLISFTNRFANVSHVAVDGNAFATSSKAMGYLGSSNAHVIPPRGVVSISRNRLVRTPSNPSLGIGGGSETLLRCMMMLLTVTLAAPNTSRLVTTENLVSALENPPVMPTKLPFTAVEIGTLTHADMSNVSSAIIINRESNLVIPPPLSGGASSTTDEYNYYAADRQQLLFYNDSLSVVASTSSATAIGGGTGGSSSPTSADNQQRALLPTNFYTCDNTLFSNTSDALLQGFGGTVVTQDVRKGVIYAVSHNGSIAGPYPVGVTAASTYATCPPPLSITMTFTKGFTFSGGRDRLSPTPQSKSPTAARAIPPPPDSVFSPTPTRSQSNGDNHLPALSATPMAVSSLDGAHTITATVASSVLEGKRTPTPELPPSSGGGSGNGGNNGEGRSSQTISRTVIVVKEELVVLVPQAAPPEAVAAVTAVATAIGGAAAAVDAQTIAVVGLVACARKGGSGEQRHASGQLRALSIVAFDDTCEGVLLGNTIALVVVAALSCVGVAFMHSRKAAAIGPHLAGVRAALAAARTPHVLLMACAYFMNSYAVCGLEVAMGGSGPGGGVVAIVFAVLLVPLYPLLTCLFGTRRLLPVVYVEPGWVGRACAVLLPHWSLDVSVGSDKAFGVVFGAYRRLGWWWSLTSHASFVATLPMVLADGSSCGPLFALSAALFFLFAVIVATARPRRTTINDVLHAAMLFVNGLVVGLSAGMVWGGNSDEGADPDNDSNLSALGTVVTVITVIRVICTVMQFAAPFAAKRGLWKRGPIVFGATGGSPSDLAADMKVARDWGMDIGRESFLHKDDLLLTTSSSHASHAEQFWHVPDCCFPVIGDAPRRRSQQLRGDIVDVRPLWPLFLLPARSTSSEVGAFGGGGHPRDDPLGASSTIFEELWDVAIDEGATSCGVGEKGGITTTTSSSTKADTLAFDNDIDLLSVAAQQPSQVHVSPTHHTSSPAANSTEGADDVLDHVPHNNVTSSSSRSVPSSKPALHAPPRRHCSRRYNLYEDEDDEDGLIDDPLLKADIAAGDARYRKRLRREMDADAIGKLFL